MVSRPLAAVFGIVFVALIGASGYLIGTAGASSDREAARAEQSARLTALGDAREQAYANSFEDGKTQGFREGAADGEDEGVARGDADGTEGVETRLAAIEEREAADAAAAATATPSPPAGLTYTDQLPNGQPGYVLPEDQRTLACVGYDAATGQCVGD